MDRPHTAEPLSSEHFMALARCNPINAALLARLPSLGLKQCFLAAGCLFQATWNALSGLPAYYGVKDYDVFYFDDTDLSWEAEDALIQRAAELTHDLGVTVEVKNQARVHLWYEARFGVPYPRLQSTRNGIDRFLIACTCIGIDVETGKLYAPNGLADLQHGILRQNPIHENALRFQEKAQAYRERWPWLTIA